MLEFKEVKYIGLIILTILTLLIIPAVYIIWRGFYLPKEAAKKIGE